MSYVVKKAKEYALKGIDELIKFDLRKAEQFVKEHSKDYISPQILDLLEKTYDIDPIPRYYIIDAVLSNRFEITLAQARDAWQKELDYAQKLHESIQIIAKRDSIPRVYQCARFALNILKHLMQRGLTETMLTYDLSARNFIVGLTVTQQCVCLSYTLYVQSIVNHFGYDDYVSECSVTGHIFTLTNAKDIDSYKSVPNKKFFLLGFDAGFFDNNFLEVHNWGSHEPYTMDQVKKMIDWDPLFFVLVEKTDLPKCHVRYYWGRDKKTQNSRLAGELWMESSVKKTYIKMIRNQIILLKIFEELSDYKNLQYAIAMAKFQVETEILEYESLIMFFDRNNFTPLKNRLAEYEKIELKKAFLLLMSLNRNKTTSNFTGRDRDLICAQGLLQLFKPYTKTWSIEQFLVLCEIAQKYKILLRDHLRFAEKVSIEIGPETEFTIMFDLRDKYKQHNFSLFRVKYVTKNQWMKYFEELKVMKIRQTLYSHPSNIHTIPSEALSHLDIVIIPMDKSLFIITFDFPDKESKYIQLVAEQRQVERNLIERIKKYKNGTYLRPRPKHSTTGVEIEKLRKRIEAANEIMGNLLTIPSQYLQELKALEERNVFDGAKSQPNSDQASITTSAPILEPPSTYSVAEPFQNTAVSPYAPQSKNGNIKPKNKSAITIKTTKIKTNVQSSRQYNLRSRNDRLHLG
jgi:hypothetical protein